MSERPPISPRSPRAALEPEQVPPPPKRSERARNPFVVVGNAIITIVLVADDRRRRRLLSTASRRSRLPARCRKTRSSTFPRAPGMADIADILQREGVIDNNRWAFIGSVFALKARSDLKPGEYSFQKNASLRDVIGTIVEGKVVQHAVTIPGRPDLRTDRGAAFGQRDLCGLGPRNPARGHACCRRPTNSRAAPRASR